MPRTLSPAQRLPLEVVERIAMFAAQSPEHFASSYGRITLQLNKVLSRGSKTCRLWCAPFQRELFEDVHLTHANAYTFLALQLADDFAGEHHRRVRRLTLILPDDEYQGPYRLIVLLASHDLHYLSVEIRGFVLDAELSQKLRSLKTLEIRRLEAYPFKAYQGTRPVLRNLQTLHLRQVNFFLAAVCVNQVDMPALRHISLDCTGPSHEPGSGLNPLMRRLFTASGTNLKVAHISLLWDPSIPLNRSLINDVACHMSECVALRELRLALPTIYDYKFEDADANLAPFDHILDSIPPANSLATLWIELDLHTESQWRRFVDTVERSVIGGTWTHLRTLNIVQKVMAGIIVDLFEFFEGSVAWPTPEALRAFDGRREWKPLRDFCSGRNILFKVRTARIW